MSDFVNHRLAKDAVSMDIAPRLSGYSGVEIIVDENTVIFSGNRTGRVLSIENENGTQEMANGILARISGFQYQPYTATDAFLDPAAEINDGIILNNVFSGIYKVSRTYAPLMTANLEAPHEEEIDHEYPYESSKERKVKRELADARAQIKVTSNAITAEVLRATTAEEELQASITATAEEISANVVKKVDGDTSSFGWSLTNSAWSVSSNNQEVFRIDSSGATVKGTIRATSGEIGGFTIGQSSIYSGMTSFGDTTHNGVYIGTNGISIGKGNFKADSAGNVTLKGTLNIGGTNITAATLRSGAQSAYDNGGSWTTGANNGNSAMNILNGNAKCSSLHSSGAVYADGTLFAYGSFVFGKNPTHTVTRGSIVDGNGVTQYVLKWS